MILPFSNTPGEYVPDVFISMLNSAGQYIWAGKIGALGHDDAYSVSVDGSDNIYVGGIFQGEVDLDPTTNTALHTGLDGFDESIFLLKLSGPLAAIEEHGAGPAQIFPLPARDVLHVNGTAAGTQLVLYDLQGRQLTRSRSTGLAIDLDMQQLAPGTYVLALITAAGRETHVVVKE